MEITTERRDKNSRFCPRMSSGFLQTRTFKTKLEEDCDPAHTHPAKISVHMHNDKKEEVHISSH